ncbi:MAG TPA: hypothetical protein ENJ77_01635 [Candidatus Moranbacteria bacterium]|nr:hypothetical protein [Candidatus Moranbacteria bacterium]
MFYRVCYNTTMTRKLSPGQSGPEKAAQSPPLRPRKRKSARVKIAVVCGGVSEEREVSLRSGREMLLNLQP